MTAVMADTVRGCRLPGTTCRCTSRRRTLASSRYSPSCSSLPCRLPTLSNQVLRPASSVTTCLASALRDPGQKRTLEVKVTVAYVGQDVEMLLLRSRFSSRPVLGLPDRKRRARRPHPPRRSLVALGGF